MEKLQDSEAESENGIDFTCEICIEPNTLANKFRNADKCSHPFCTDCVITYIRSKLENDNTGKIKCPASDCVKRLDPLDCASVIGRSMLIRWSDVLCEALVSGLYKCYCPSINCKELIVYECFIKPKKSQCPKCKNWFCFHCKIDWHAGFRCDESLQPRDDNDVAFGRLAESNNWRRCPQCSYYCEKVDGCEAVKCRCGTEYCYVCGRLTSVCCGGCNPPSSCCENCFYASILILFLIFGLALIAGLGGFIWWLTTLA